MGWQAVIVVVPDAQVTDLAVAGWAPTGATVYAEEAASFSFEGIAMLERSERLVFLGGVDLVDAAESLRPLGTVYVGMMMSTVSMYQWRVLGPDGDRDLIYGEEGLIQDVGSPHPAEEGMGVLGEDQVFELLHRATGFEFDDEVLEARAQVIEPMAAPPASAPEAAGPTKRPWNPFRRR